MSTAPTSCAASTHTISTGVKTSFPAEIFKLEERTTVWKVRLSLRFLVNSESQRHHQGRMAVPASGGLCQAPCQLQHRPNPPWKWQREQDFSRPKVYWLQRTARNSKSQNYTQDKQKPSEAFGFQVPRSNYLCPSDVRQGRKGERGTSLASISSLKLATETLFQSHQ